jgi:hypothetical protein
VLKLAEFQLLLCCERGHFAIDLRHTVHQVSAREAAGSHSDLTLVNRTASGCYTSGDLFKANRL